MKNGDFSELLANRGSNLNSVPQLKIPQGHPGAGSPLPNNNIAPYMTPLGTYLASLYPDPNYNDPNNLFQLRLPLAGAAEPRRDEDAVRLEHQQQHQGVRADLARSGHSGEARAARGGRPPDVALPTPNVDKELGRSYSTNLVSVLSPSMTNELVVSYTRLTLDNSWKDPSLVAQGTNPGGVSFNGIQFPYPTAPELPTQLLHGWGGSGQVGNLWSAAPNVYAHNDSLQFSDKLTKLMGAHGLKFGLNVERGQKQQDFQNNESGQLWFGSDNGTGTGNSAADLITGNIGELDQGTAIKGKPLPGMPYGEFRYWDIDAFAQDSWKLRPNFTLEYGIRFGKWTNNEEIANSEGGYFTESLYDPTKGSFLDPGTNKLLNGVCYVYNGCGPAGVLPNRSAFVLPRINAAWDIDGQGKNVLRGGYGLFYNRSMGNVEYDNSLRLPPNAYAVEADFWNSGGIANGTGLTYDTASLITMESRLGSIGINTPTPDSFKWPTTHSFSVSYARRIPWNQVVEVAYVGTKGRDLVSRTNGNVMPYGIMSQGTYNGVDLSVPINRVAVASNSDNLASFRPFNALKGITLYDFRGTSDYNSMQVTLSRQTGKRLQYFLAYTYGKTKGTLGGEYSVMDPYDPNRTYGVLNTDRSHILNVSWNAFLPDGARGKIDNASCAACSTGGSSPASPTLASGIPITPIFSGDAASGAVSASYFGTADVVGASNSGGNALAPVYSCDPTTGNIDVGEKILNLDCIHVPEFGKNGSLVPPYNIRTPTRVNHDLTVFKNFQVHGDQKVQVRFGFFNLFNQAFANTNIGNDILLTLNTVCNVKGNAPDGRGGIQNVCDPTQGFHYDQQTIDNFGTIKLKRGHRVVEFVLKYYF
jgi:hypothetical protein